MTNGTAPPDESLPDARERRSGRRRRATAIGLPDIPGLPFNDRILNPVLRYDFGAGFIAADLSGVIARVPPRVVGVVPTYVPRVNEDGNETAGVPSVQHAGAARHVSRLERDARRILAGQGCGFQGGCIPFAKTKAERIANKDPRLSIEERYGTHDAYVARVKRAAEQAVQDRFLLRDDAERLVREAEASEVLRAPAGAMPDVKVRPVAR